MQSLSHQNYSAICTVLTEASRRRVGFQYPKTYLKAWAKLSSLARLADAEKVMSQPSYKPIIDPVVLLMQYARNFDIVFAPQSTLATVLKNIARNGLPSLSEPSYTITELSNLTK